MLFVPTFSAWFYGMYIAAGISDMLDGFVARRTKTTSEFGAKLDSIADVIFVAICLIKVLPCIQISIWLWVWIIVIATIKVFNIMSGVIWQKKLVMPHTPANKLTGLLLFLMPLFMQWILLEYLAVPICAIATFAAVQEGHYIRTGHTEY